MHFSIVIYAACKSLAKMYRLFLSTSHFDLEGWPVSDVSPQLNFVGGVFPPGITNIFKNSHLCQFLMDSNDLYIYE